MYSLTFMSIGQNLTSLFVNCQKQMQMKQGLLGCLLFFFSLLLAVEDASQLIVWLLKIPSNWTVFPYEEWLTDFSVFLLRWKHAHRKCLSKYTCEHIEKKRCYPYDSGHWAGVRPHISGEAGEAEMRALWSLGPLGHAEMEAWISSTAAPHQRAYGEKQIFTLSPRTRKTLTDAGKKVLPALHELSPTLERNTPRTCTHTNTHRCTQIWSHLPPWNQKAHSYTPIYGEAGNAGRVVT